jgi:hypothetical protein
VDGLGGLLLFEQKYRNILCGKGQGRDQACGAAADNNDAVLFVRNHGDLRCSGDSSLSL